MVRFLDTSGKDLIPRKDRVWSVKALATRMQMALEAAGREVPTELGKLVAGTPAKSKAGRAPERRQAPESPSGKP